MCSLARAPALQRLISAACAKAVVSSQTNKNVQDDEVEQKEEEEEVDEVPFEDDDDAFPPMDDYDDGFRQSSLSSINTPLKQTASVGSEENMSSFGGIQVHERTKRVIEDLHPELIEKGSIEDFRDTLRPGASRKEAAAGFFELRACYEAQLGGSESAGCIRSDSHHTHREVEIHSCRNAFFLKW